MGVRPGGRKAQDIARGEHRYGTPQGGPAHGPGIELHLEPGAHLLFSPDPEHYLPVVETRWEGTRVLSYSPLIYARDVEDVAITGSGTIDGNARSGFHAWHPRADPDMQRLRRMGFTGVPLEERVFGAGTYLRPPLVQFVRARRVLLEDFGWAGSGTFTRISTCASAPR